MMEEKRKKGEQQQQHGPAVGARLYFNYTAGCARASSNLVGPLSLSLTLSLFLSPPEPSFALLCTTPRGLSRPLLVSQATRGIPPKREETKEEEEPRCTAHRFSPPFNHSRLAVQPLIVSPIPFLFPSGTRIFTREKKERKGILFEER